MIVVCTHCNASYTIPDEKAPKHRAVATCKKCQHKIVIEPDPVIQPVPGLGGVHPSEPSQQAIETFTHLLLADFPKLRALSVDRYAFWKIFLPGPGGGYKNRPNKLKVKLLGAVDPVLDRALIEAEKVLFVAGALARSAFDVLLINRWFTGRYSRYALIGTDRRLLMININRGHKRPLHYIFQLPYKSIKSVGRGLFKSGIILKPYIGKRRAFKSMRQASAAELYGFLREQIEKRQPEQIEIEDPAEFICPACFMPFQNASNRCPLCKAEFKSPVGAAIRSLILPGWGNLYIGRRLLGLLEITLSVVIWLIVLDAYLANNHYVALMAIYLAAVYNGCDGILTFFAARKGWRLDKRSA